MESELAAPNVAELKKIRVNILAGAESDTMDITPQPIPFTFIYGVGSAGLTQFEYTLAQKSAGDKVKITLKTHQLCPFFGHLLPPVPYLMDSRQNVYLQVEIVRVENADSREVIKAMATASTCSGDCCGNH